MLIGYFDDSGKETDPSNRFVCMAGYLAIEYYWESFWPQWDQMLIKHGIRWIHMKTLIPMQDEYKGMEQTKRNEIIGDCIKIFKENELIGFGVGVDAEGWRAVPEGIRKKHGNAQEFCFSRILRMIIDRIKLVPHQRLAMFFDCDQEFSNRRFNLFSQFRERHADVREYLASIAFASPVLYYPLQAADVLAWQTRKELIQKAGGFESTEHFKQMMVEVPGLHGGYVGELWDKKSLDERIAKGMEL